MGLAMAPGVWAQSPAPAKSSIYTCIDAQGRRLTSDRPIRECIDREQRELSSSGTTKRVLPPSYTAEERARLDAEKREAEQQQARLDEERRRDRVLIMRYPNRDAHDKARADALAQVDEVIDTVNKRLGELDKERQAIHTELEFYKGDPSQAPAWLRRKITDQEQQVGQQRRFLDERQQEKQRINQRFDEELGRLRTLWSSPAARN